jgi:ABC-type sugar transport system ATPase subunit
MGRIVLEQVTKKYGDVEVIPPLDLTIQDGEFTVFVGPSGCGKSTLLRLIAGLEDVSSGSIQIDGKAATDMAPSKRGLAMVFQSYALYPHMSVRKNIAFPLRMAKMDPAEIAKKVEGAAAVLNLTDYLSVVRANYQAVNVSGLLLAARSFASLRRSCLTSRCRTSMRPCVLACAWKYPSCTPSLPPQWSM